jgi:hypothetical protein
MCYQKICGSKTRVGLDIGSFESRTQSRNMLQECFALAHSQRTRMSFKVIVCLLSTHLCATNSDVPVQFCIQKISSLEDLIDQSLEAFKLQCRRHSFECRLVHDISHKLSPFGTKSPSMYSTRSVANLFLPSDKRKMSDQDNASAFDIIQDSGQCFRLIIFVTADEVSFS